MTAPDRSPARLRSAACLLAAGALAVPLWACATRTVDTKIIDRDGIDVFLRHRLERGEEVERGFAHPAEISPDRLTLILATTEVERSAREGLLRRKVSRREAAFEDELVEPLAAAVSEALTKANSKQEVAVRAVSSERRLAVFVRKFVTSFITYAEDDTLYLDLSRLHWEIPKDAEDEKPPMPKRGEKVMDFRLLPGPGMRAAGPQLLAVSWRDPAFDLDASETPQPESEAPGAQPVASSEEPGSDVEGASSSELPPHLDSATLRELADLEEARERGEIAESYYQRQRQKLLAGGTEGDAEP